MLRNAVTLKHLRALLAVAEHRSLTAAADVLHQSTPAIHSQIRRLEDVTGRSLLERAGDGTGFCLTPAGEVMARAARRMEANLSQAAAEIGVMTLGHQGHVTLSVVSTAKYFAPRLVRMLRDTCPEIRVALRVGNRQQVIADLDQHAADLAVMGRPPRVPLVLSEPLGAHPHGVILPPDHPLARQDGFDPMLLLDETFLAREEGSGTRILMARFLDRLAEGQSPLLMEMDSNETIKQAVMAGLGVAFLSLHTVQDELAAGRLVALRGPGLPIMRQWYLVRPVEPAATGAALRIAEAIVALAGAYFPQPPAGAR